MRASDVADRLVLTERVRFYGDDIAAVVAEDEVSAAQALRAIKVEYEEYPFVLDVMESMKDGAPQIHEEYPNNILKHTTIQKGNYEEAIKEPGLIKVEDGTVRRLFSIVTSKILSVMRKWRETGSKW